MTTAPQKPSSAQMFPAAEQAGLKLAVKGRIVPVMFVAGLLFVALGLLLFCFIGSLWDRPWVKFAFITVDIALFCLAVASFASRLVVTRKLPQIQNPHE